MTFSYDDGVIQDREVVRILKAHHMRGTFNLNPGKSGEKKFRLDSSGHEIDCSYLRLEEEKDVYEGMEVANHTFSHPRLEEIDFSSQKKEFLKGREGLETLFQRKVHGVAYPYGTYDADTIWIEKNLGIEYARTTRSTYDFALPPNWLFWNPTAHHRDKRIFSVIDDFLASDRELALLYIWGHGYEFAIDHNFGLLDDICSRLKDESVCCLTNHELYCYVNAADSVYYSKKNGCFVNPSDMDVFLIADGQRIAVRKNGEYQYEYKE